MQSVITAIRSCYAPSRTGHAIHLSKITFPLRKVASISISYMHITWRTFPYHQMKITELPDIFCLLISFGTIFKLPCSVHHSKHHETLSSSFPFILLFPPSNNLPLPHECVSFFFFWRGGDKKTNDYHTLDVLFEILVPFTLKPVGKCLKGFHVSSVVLLSKLKQHGPCEIWVHPWVAIVH